MDRDQAYDSRTISILLVSASLILLANGVYIDQLFSIQYGAGAGALLQSNAYNNTVIPALQFVAGNTGVLYQTTLESYLLIGIGVIMFAVALIMFTHGTGKYESFIRRYLPLHGALAVVYIFMLLIIHSAYSFTLASSNLYATYIALAICIVFDIYMEYRMRILAAGRKGIRGISIDPLTPYSNIVKLKEELFGSMSGSIRIVDKHFNSAALANLHRLLPEGASGIKSISVITSSEMLNTGFEWDYKDMMQELHRSGIEFEMRIMDPKESATQHERFILDDKNAYKIPPFNIINRKSEHIVRMGHGDARKRYEQLSHTSAKLENYLMDMSRKKDTK